MTGIFVRSTAAPNAPKGAPAEQRLSWSRLLFAAGLLVSLFAATLLTGGEPKYADVHPVLIHSFELVLGAVLGILTGEAAHT